MLRDLSVFAFCSIAAIPALAQETPVHAFVYTTKYLCTQPSSGALPGSECRGRPCHDTEISIYNPTGATSNLLLTAVEACPIDAYPISRYGEALAFELGPDEAVRVGCDVIDRIVLAERFVRGERRLIPNGIFRVESDGELDISVTRFFDRGGESDSAQVDHEKVEPRLMPIMRSTEP